MKSKQLLPPPPEPTAEEDQKQDVFKAVVTWLCNNYGLLARGEKRGSGLAVPLRTRVIDETGLTAFRTKMLPYRLEIIGPKGGITRLSR